MLFKKSGHNLRFYPSIEGLENVENIAPYPAKKYIPSWWKQIPLEYEQYPTIKRCPAIPDFFTQGYILPMWDDCSIKDVDKNIIGNTLKNNSIFTPVDMHGEEMFLEHYRPKIGDKEVKAIAKFNSPWYIFTNPGWSTLVLPVFYEFNQNLTILPGVVDTDTFHQMNHPALIHNQYFDIPSGSPFAMYIPFKRTKYNINILSKSIKIDKILDNMFDNWINKQELHLGQGFGFKSAYRKIQKERDSNIKIKNEEKWIEGNIV